MKKLLAILLLLFLAVMLFSCRQQDSSGPSDLDEPDPVYVLPNPDLRVSIYTKAEYDSFVDGNKKLPSNFVYFDQVSSFGEFFGFVDISVLGDAEFSDYHYGFTSPTGKYVSLDISHRDAKTKVVSTKEYLMAENGVDLRFRADGASGTVLMPYGEYQYVDGELLSISWITDGTAWTLYGDVMLAEYDTDDMDTAISRLLSPDTAEAAMKEIMENAAIK